MNNIKKYWGIILAIILSSAAIILFVVLLTQIFKVQNQIQVSQKANIRSRVTTVQQRCDLTSLDWQNAKDKNPKLAPKYYQSLLGCQKQLIAVKRVNALTP